MVKYYSNEDILKFSWDQVAQAFWARYPNPYSSHVLTEDVVYRRIRGTKLYTKRLLTKTNRMPKWGEKIVSARSVRIIEESIVDLVDKSITTYTRNIGHNSILSIEEKCIYRPSPESVRSTTIQREAWVSSSLYGLARAVQAFAMDRFKKNVLKATKGFTFVLDRMFSHGPSLPESHPTLLMDKERLRETAKKATELAKSKAAPLMAACASNRQ